MGSSTNLPTKPAATFLTRFREAADVHGRMSFARFMQLALYDPELGYYRKKRARIGYEPGTDFYTASTSAPLFGELIEAAARELLAGYSLGEYTFVEIGAEPQGGVIAGRPHGFGATCTLPLGADLALTGPCVVFSNELFDAQPCRRFVFRQSQWLELGVACDQGTFIEVTLGVARHADYLPLEAAEGYIIDAPQAAVELLEKIVHQPWHGLFIACDYGKSWNELTSATPAGTARAYHRHTQSNDLLAQPGEQDLTCHVCWDWLAQKLVQNGFIAPKVESQEAFLVHHAARYLAETSVHEASRLSQRKLALMQLLHPAHLGQKFQVLHALRPAP